MRNEIYAQLPAGPWPPPPPTEAIVDQDIIKGYLQDASRLVGHASTLFRPRDEAELASILYHLNREGTPVTVVARQTSTTGSSVPQGGAIISMEKLAKLLEIDPTRRLARAQSGILLGDFQRAVEEVGWLYPPDPTSRNESSLGASVACNASGARTFKYGATRAYVHRLRVLLAEGYVIDVARGQVEADDRHQIQLVLPDGTRRAIPCPTFRQPLVKHAAGYHSGDHIDLVDLFIGSEGTLGVILEVEVRLLPRPEKVVSILACWPDEASALRFVQAARAARKGGELDPRCLEWLDANALRIVAEHHPDQAMPAEAGAAVFFEQECTGETESTLLEKWYELLVETGALVDLDRGVIVADTAARQEMLYDMRHSVPAGVNEKAARNGMPKLGTDLAVPDEALEAMMEAYATGVADVPGTLGVVESLEVMRELSGVTLPGPVTGETVVRVVTALEAAVPVNAAGHAAPARSAGEAPNEASIEARVQALWDRMGLPRSFEYATFGHIGNNHVHVNLLPTTASGLLVARRLYDVLTRRAIALGGTVSGEHGIGKIKRTALKKLFGPEAIEQMAAVKRALDPKGILGVGNLFDPPARPAQAVTALPA